MAASAFGLPTQALALLMVIFGLLILFVPPLLPWLVAILLIVVGVAWLVGSVGWTREPAWRRDRYAPPRV